MNRIRTKLGTLSIVLVLSLIELSINEAKSSYRKPVRVGLLKKRQESLCPLEYQSCWCDYINTNNNNENIDLKYSGSSSSFLSSSSGGSSASYPTSSIMIDCQYYSNSKTNATSHGHTTKINNNNNMLTEIPRVVSRYKHLHQISYIDLSRTGIREVPTDAFRVCIYTQVVVFWYIQ
jgi:hypothetical protein